MTSVYSDAVSIDVIALRRCLTVIPRVTRSQYRAIDSPAFLYSHWQTAPGREIRAHETPIISLFVGRARRSRYVWLGR
jgi:hypothetical protein